MKKEEKRVDNMIATNKQAFHDYEILSKLEVGIVLSGSEVKSCRDKSVQLKGSYIVINKGKLLLLNANIAQYSFASGYFSHNPIRERVLLAHKKEILRLNQQIKEKGLTIIPLTMYFSKNLVKLNIGVCRGKHNFDKREDLKKAQLKLDYQRRFK